MIGKEATVFTDDVVAGLLKRVSALTEEDMGKSYAQPLNIRLMLFLWRNSRKGQFALRFLSCLRAFSLQVATYTVPYCNYGVPRMKAS